ncbi:hypothetical protein NCU16348 [Neurospora crassa OR74A]|uniref:Uncharacterized protein n=1 Tax=Neurospora crassa (strain ATCC 24698 / 74-OR23-1A / CBS 708.71 / DSM 1257 / FGSC 987) TaxID=367110 RepID=V5IQN2_NEUCR|nr:hypothetical protein NCU16348 [Neurospora crassa OR74A]ESA43864.1 hypothetical protein NCU16348 [Neurospora crassa OR74A]|eukprot:XP_011393351.1 hypothetical protein NCU16348 [Neurospora crassa OR74A]
MKKNISSAYKAGRMHIISSSSTCLEVADTAHGCCSAGLCAVAGSWCKAFFKGEREVITGRGGQRSQVLSAAIQGLHLGVNWTNAHG